jgi:hypothetical protein
MGRLNVQGRINLQGNIHFVDAGIPTLPRFGIDAAYSVRRLFNEYNGPLMRVRRSSDNAELDIGYTKFNLLDEASILNFCGISTGTVVAWYDQSGNGYTAGVSNAAYSVGFPVIYQSGTILRLLGSPTIPAIFFASSNGLITSTTLPNFNFNSVFAVESHQYQGIDSSNERIYDKRRSNLLLSVFRTAGINLSEYTYGRGGASSLSLNTFPSATFFAKPLILDESAPTDVSADIRVNNALQTIEVFRTGAQQDNANFALGIGTNVINVPPGGGNYFSGSISELIIYNTDIQAFRQAIISNINYYYQAF